LTDATSRRRSFAVRGELVRTLRLRRGWSQLEAAQRADLSDRIIRKAENGGPVSVSTITSLACLYDHPQERLSPEQLLMDPSAAFLEPPPVPNTEAMLKRWFDGLWNHLDLSVIDELIVPEFAFHAETGVVRNRQEMRERVLKFRESFSDFDFVVEQTSDLVDAVVCRWRVAMTHSGPWLDLPATGRRVVVNGSSWVQLIGDKFGDAWDYWDPALVYAELTTG
jgi:transcriptional regulator with XRE-family HTH domain